MRVQQLIDLNKRSAKHINKVTLVARGADTQLNPSCESAPLAANVDCGTSLCAQELAPSV